MNVTFHCDTIFQAALPRVEVSYVLIPYVGCMRSAPVLYLYTIMMQFLGEAQSSSIACLYFVVLYDISAHLLMLKLQTRIHKCVRNFCHVMRETRDTSIVNLKNVIFWGSSLRYFSQRFFFSKFGRSESVV